MRILYAIQATGNGHISRAMELMPYLQQYGQVDVFLSGNNSNLFPNLPVVYRSKGLSLFYGNTGGLDYLHMWRELDLKRIWKESRDLPVEKYDIVLNDFESITSLACWRKGIPSLGFGHQASFHSRKTPRPAKKNFAGEAILDVYARATDYIGLHFRPYDTFITPPVIKQKIVAANPCNKGHITVYLSHYSDEVIRKALMPVTEIRFEVFSKKIQQRITDGHITWLPVNNDAFTESLIHSHGVITGAGFETPAEALYLGKQLLCLPIKGQYEQLCNAEALKEFGVTVLDTIDHTFCTHVRQWLQHSAVQPLMLSLNTAQIVHMAIEKARTLQYTLPPVQEASNTCQASPVFP